MHQLTEVVFSPKCIPTVPPRHQSNHHKFHWASIFLIGLVSFKDTCQPSK